MLIEIELDNSKPIYLQIKDKIKDMILQGLLRRDEKLPSSRELSSMLKVSRNTIIEAYNYLEDEGFIYTIKSKGVFVGNVKIYKQEKFTLSWDERINRKAHMAEEMDIVKSEPVWEKGMISFKSISPDENLFEIEDVKRAFYERISIEGKKLLNYGYAEGYKPLIDYLYEYMQSKGVNIKDKGLIITNGFTEGFELVVSSTTNKGDSVLCENPTFNHAINIMDINGLNITGIPMMEDGIDTEELKKRINGDEKFLFTIPSYHNPTGIVTPPEKRIKILEICREANIPIIEDGFSEELRYSTSHVSPIASLTGEGNSVIYIGSFSKILFPGLRIGWIMGDKKLISAIESVKRMRNIHTSTLSQGILYEYLKNGCFERYLKKARRIYRERYEFAVDCAKKFIPNKKILGEGGLHLFLELNVNGRELLNECLKKGVIFMPGEHFFINGGGENCIRLGFSRTNFDEIKKGFKIIGDIIKKIN